MVALDHLRGGPLGTHPVRPPDLRRSYPDDRRNLLLLRPGAVRRRRKLYRSLNRIAQHLSDLWEIAQR